MALWTDIIDPAELTGYVREELATYEAEKGTLARWLPNREVADIVVDFYKGSTGLVDVADYRAYDAEIKIGKAPSRSKVQLELPALGRNIPVSEYNQLRARGGNPSDEAIKQTILNTAKLVVRAVADAQERMRGIVLVTGKATLSGFMDDDFGRTAGHTATAGASWATASTDALAHLTTAFDAYVDANGEEPGAIVTSGRVLRLLGALNQFATQLSNGQARPATEADVQNTVQAAGLPPIYKYNRRVSVGGSTTRVIADDKVLFLPAPVDTDDWMGTELGATFWGRTLTSTESDWGLEDADQPGIVAGVYRGEKPPMIAEVMGDAIGMPVLANADLSYVLDVIP